MRGTASSSASRPVYRWGVVSSPRVRRHYDTTNKPPNRDALLRPQYKRADDPRQPVCPASERPSDSNNASVGAPGCRTPTECRVHVVLCNAAVVQEAIHAYVSVVGVHHSVTGIPHYRPSAKLISQIAVFSSFGVRWRIATRVFNHSTYHSIVHTACVMLSTDSIRRESHAASRDVLQPLPTQRKIDYIYWNFATNAVDGQHSPRKPHLGTGRLATSPDTKILAKGIRTRALSIDSLAFYHWATALRYEACVCVLFSNQFLPVTVLLSDSMCVCSSSRRMPRTSLPLWPTQRRSYIRHQASAQSCHSTLTSQTQRYYYT